MEEVLNQCDSAIFFVDPACPGQGGLKEPSNGFLRRYGLPKQMDFAESDQKNLSTIGDKGNHLPQNH